MSQIETEHNGHRITYSENNDMWRCWAMNMEAKTLTALKAKLNKIDAEARRVNGVPVIIVKSYGGVDGRGLAALIDPDGGVWITYKDKVGTTRRTKEKMENIALDDASTLTAISKANAATRDTERARKIESDAWAAVPRVTLAALKSISDKKEDAA